jgi:hypothetical protein
MNPVTQPDQPGRIPSMMGQPVNPELKVVIPLFEAKGWIKFLGIMMIIGGAFACLSIWGIIIAWLPIWIGVLLNQTSNNLDLGIRSNNANTVESGMRKLKTVFTIYGIMAIVILAFYIILFIFFIIALIVSGGDFESIFD